ncbi:hypothetical protein LCGC14_2965010, partial [marine sediment metagenome]
LLIVDPTTVTGAVPPITKPAAIFTKLVLENC